MGVVWGTVGGIISRVAAEAETLMDRCAGLREIGIDEISSRKGQNDLTVVVDHKRRRLVWAAPGRDTKTLSTFFDRLGGAERAHRTGERGRRRMDRRGGRGLLPQRHLV